MRCVIIRYGEIGLKGLNRRAFETALCDNIATALSRARVLHGKVIRQFGRILIEDCADARPLATVFGIVSYSPAQRCGTTIEEIIKTALPLVKDLKAPTTFRVTVQRSQKTGPSGDDIARAVGEAICKATGAPVKLKGFDVELCVENFLDSAFVFTERLAGPGGLPIGTAGVAIALITDDASHAAALSLAQRGLRLCVVPVGNARVDKKLFEAYNAIDETLPPINDMSELDAIAIERKIPAFVVGQTLETLEEFPCDILPLRPLVGQTPEQIKEVLHAFRAAARM